jgi:hypothetical protein
MRLSNPVPNEVWESILSHLIPERDTLRAVVYATCAASGEAQRIYWRNDLAVCGLIEELLKQQKGQQQVLANMVRHVTMGFESLDHLDKSEGLQFPSLKTLSVYDDVSRPGTGLQAYARIRSLVGAFLIKLDIGSETSCLQDLPPVVDNFLPALSSSTNMRSLEIGALIDGATPDDLNAALEACKQLKTLRLERNTDPLINKKVMKTLAMHPSLEDLHIERHIVVRLAFSIVSTPDPFAHLTNLSLSATPDAAQAVLPCLKQLKTLHLCITGTNKIFSSLSQLTKLRALSLQFTAYALMDDDVFYLTYLKQLEFLQLYGPTEWQMLDTSAVSPGLFAAVLETLPVLRNLRIGVFNHLGDPCLIALGRACRSLRSLTLTGSFTLEPLSIEPIVLFPKLIILELGNLSPSNPLHLHEWGDIKQIWADLVAEEVEAHTPCLLLLGGCQEEPNEVTGMVHQAWERLKEKRTPFSWQMNHC